MGDGRALAVSAKGDADVVEADDEAAEEVFKSIARHSKRVSAKRSSRRGRAGSTRRWSELLKRRSLARRSLQRSGMLSVDSVDNLETDSFVNADGLRIGTYRWAATATASGPGERKGVVWGLHGVGSYALYNFLKRVDYDASAPGYEGATFHALAYRGSWVETFNNAGFDVVAMDLASYGRSEGARGLRYYAERFEDHVRDLRQYRELIAADAAADPVFMLGVSYGGCAAVRVVQEEEAAGAAGATAIAGVVLLSPMLSLEKVKTRPVNKFLLPVSQLLSQLIPTWRLAQPEPHPHAEMQAHYESDPANEVGDSRVRVATECLAAVDAARENVADVKCPLLVFHSKNDLLTDPEGSQWFVEHAASEDKQLRLLEDPYTFHQLMHEPSNLAIKDEVLSWLNKQHATA